MHADAPVFCIVGKICFEIRQILILGTTRTQQILVLLLYIKGPSIKDVTHFLKSLTPPSPLSPILLNWLRKSPFGRSLLPLKWVTSFMDYPPEMLKNQHTVSASMQPLGSIFQNDFLGRVQLKITLKKCPF